MSTTIPPSGSKHIRQSLRVHGRVQGVGFRPYVYRIATELGLAGHVGNDSDGAFVEIEGSGEAIATFRQRLVDEVPPLAHIAEVIATQLPPTHERSFSIQHSRSGASQEAEITPDAATCADCRRELFDPADRRYRYAFINCTNCGPRYSIVRSVPYDRPFTTMAKFKMCPACQAEYDNPADRRFHAQPNACPICGPQIWLTDAAGRAIRDEPVALCAQQIRLGRIVAIKGIGGFHLACDATSEYAVQRLRMHKGREAKPFAVMVASLAAARELGYFDDTAAAALLDVERPIVLVPKRESCSVAEAVAPDSDCFGVMLAYTPLHHLLFAEGLGPLVMTSGNPSAEPLCCDNTEALERLAGIADYFLLHDRDIERRVDDSVVMTLSKPVPRAVPIRRARGFAPSSIQVEVEAPEPILAVGGELKSTVCILAGRRAVLSEHLGDLSNAAAFRNFIGTVDRPEALLRTEPKVIAHDLHPDYASTHYARRLASAKDGAGGPAMIPVQHHHAHVVSCMADNGISGRVIGLACDGTGYGTDGAIWGCELFACDEAGFERRGQLPYFPLLGGDAAAHETWRPAAGLLSQMFGSDWRQASAAFKRIPQDALQVAERQLERGSRVPQTSSLGRLFDAVAFLLGVCDRNRYEAEAAMTLEALARQCASSEALEYSIDSAADAPMHFNVRPMLRELVRRMSSGGDPAILARAFHETMAALLAKAAMKVGLAAGLKRIVLSGGCFANRLLLERMTDRLLAGEFEVFVHDRVPTGDGGIALGQAVAAAAMMARANHEATGRSS